MPFEFLHYKHRVGALNLRWQTYKVQNLVICEFVFAELGKEEAHLAHFTAEEVRERSEDVEDLLLADLVVQVEQVQALADL